MKFTEDESIILNDKSGNLMILILMSNITVTETITFKCKKMNINVGENITTIVGMNSTETIGINKTVCETLKIFIFKNYIRDRFLRKRSLVEFEIIQELFIGKMQDYCSAKNDQLIKDCLDYFLRCKTRLEKK